MELAAAIFSESDNLENAVDNILKTFPFVRIYDWGEGLDKDEYLVLYRHMRGEKGHYFVKYEDGKLDRASSNGEEYFINKSIVDKIPSKENEMLNDIKHFIE